MPRLVPIYGVEPVITKSPAHMSPPARVGHPVCLKQYRAPFLRFVNKNKTVGVLFISGGVPVQYKVTFLAWRKGKKWCLTWGRGENRTSRYFATEQEAKACMEQKTAHVGRERQRMAQARKERKRGTNTLTVDGLLDAYLARDGIREITRKADTYHAVHLRRLLGHRKASRLTEVDARAFMAAQREKGLRQTTVNRRAKILRAAYNWAVREGMLRASPLAGLRLPYARSQRLLPPTPAELRQILAVAPKHIQRLVWLGYCTGARPGPSELFRLAWSDVSESAGAALMPCAAKRPGGHDYRKIPLRSDLIDKLRAWRVEDEGCEWVINYHGKQVKNLGAAWRAALRRAGITRRITVYGLRHAFATESIRAGGDIRSKSTCRKRLSCLACGKV